NGPYYGRNLALFGSPLGPSYERTSGGVYHYTNGIFGPRPLLSNVVRNAGLQLTFPSGWVNDEVDRAVAGIHHVLGIAENDSRTTWEGTTFSVPGQGQQRFEDRAPNTFLFLVALAAGVACLAARKRFRPELFA